MTNYQKRKAKNDEYRSRIKRFTLQFSLGDGEAREWFEQQPEQGTYLKGLILRDKAEQLGYREQKASTPRRAGDYEIIQSIRMGGMTMLIGYNPTDTTYMTCYQDYDFLGNERFSEAIGSKSYVEITVVMRHKISHGLDGTPLDVFCCFKPVFGGEFSTQFSNLQNTERYRTLIIGVIVKCLKGLPVAVYRLLNFKAVIADMRQSLGIRRQHRDSPFLSAPYHGSECRFPFEVAAPASLP